MAKNSSGFAHVAKTATFKSAAPGLDGNAVHNRILLALPAKERAAVLSQLEFIEMPTHHLLNELGEPIENCYFVNSGVASILNIMSDGKSVEVGLSGKEGFVGLPVVVGLASSPTRVVMQVAGSAFRISTPGMVRLLRKFPELEKHLNRYAQELGLQATQVAACNRLHGVEQRMARWLLMSQDRIGGDVVPLTQEFLAHMLGTRRASVTEAAGMLQKKGLIKYSRGGVAVLDREKPERASCECYAALARQSRSWQQEQP